MRALSLMRMIALVGLVLLVPPATAQEWPSRPVRFINPFGAGGVNDTIVAASRPGIESRLKQPMVVENRTGGGGQIGMQAIALAAPDGYTFGMVPSNTMVISQFLFKSTLDPLKDFIPVTVLVDVPLLLAVTAKHPARSVGELLADIRANPGKFNFASPGLGTPPHLASEMLVRSLGLSAVHIPYKGGHDSAMALATGEVQFMVIAQASLASQIAAGTVRPLAVAAKSRLQSLPDLPTFEQAGHADLQQIIPRNWWGIIAPKGTPAAIVNRLADEFRQVIAEPEAQRRVRAVGLETVGSTPAQFAAQLPDEARRWGDLIRTMDLKAQ
ncbi:MAG: tripartite tricarboxylate transporter substrate binding protein [Betaproteobacteria bacterium]|nr:tripartite tricarboxylate transporter substrate binding protein [Betaproteobacteria bacterium]